MSRCEARVFDPEEIRDKNIFPKGFYPLPHPNHPEGGIFTAARADDVAKFDSVIASDFYIYHGGVRFNGDAVMAVIKAQHAAGKRFEWNVTEPDVHIRGNTAWIAYVNHGSITDASGTLSQKWLESAFLQKQAGIWKIVFMHSTLVAAVPPESHGK